MEHGIVTSTTILGIMTGRLTDQLIEKPTETNSRT